mmetsp:Transcript_53915/g.115794  ORF Transcript_53915/g.115794 Transcript_53915/m.115794 type:complete len:222 (+) Transcript_53915:739-1404(+)
MPTRSGSPASLLKARARRCSSKRRVSSAQSSKAKFLKRGSPSPMSQTSFTAMMSSTSIGSVFSGSSSFFSSCFSSGFSSAFSSAFTSAFSTFSFSPDASPSSPSLHSLPSFSAAALAASSAASASAAAFLAVSSAFFASASACLAANLAGSLNSANLFCHSWRTFWNSEYLVVNHSEGCRLSMRHKTLFFKIQPFRYSWLPFASAQAYLISSKPSVFSAME